MLKYSHLLVNPSHYKTDSYALLYNDDGNLSWSKVVKAFKSKSSRFLYDGVYKLKKHGPLSRNERKLLTSQCSKCSRTKIGIKKCGNCRIAQYCSSSCQSKDWGVHRKLCQKIQTSTGAEGLSKDHRGLLREWSNGDHGDFDANKIPVVLLEPHSWDELGESSWHMLVDFSQRPTSDGFSVSKKCQLVRELLVIGFRNTIDFLVRLKSSDGDRTERICFGHRNCINRVKEIKRELLRQTVGDPGFMDWLFSCDMLSLPRWTRTELRELWGLK